MPDLDPATYREREKHWRAEAARLSPGHERDACLQLADGYAHLVDTLASLVGSQQTGGGYGSHESLTQADGER